MEVKKIEEASKLRELQEKIVLEHDVIIEQESEEAIDPQESKECEQKPVRDVCPKESHKCTSLQFNMISLVKDQIHFPTIFLVYINCYDKLRVPFNMGSK